MTEEEKNGWGGARANCGRKAGRTKKQYNFYCSEEERDYLKNCLKDYRKQNTVKELASTIYIIDDI